MDFTDRFIETIYHVRLGKKQKFRNMCRYLSSVEDTSPQKLLYDELPVKKDDHYRIIMVGDTHDRHSSLGRLPEADIFVHCGDIFMTSRVFSHNYALRKVMAFNEWLGKINCTHKIVIAGNHDTVLQRLGTPVVKCMLTNATYLESSGCIINNRLHIWATPLSAGVSRNTAFQSYEYRRGVMEAAAGLRLAGNSNGCGDVTHDIGAAHRESHTGNRPPLHTNLHNSHHSSGSHRHSHASNGHHHHSVTKAKEEDAQKSPRLFSSKQQQHQRSLQSDPANVSGTASAVSSISNGDVHIPMAPLSAQTPTAAQIDEQQNPLPVHILVTHGRCFNVVRKVSPKLLHIWGHAHNSYGIYRSGDPCKGSKCPISPSAVSICCPIMDYLYRPHSLPVVVDISNEAIDNATALVQSEAATAVDCSHPQEDVSHSYSLGDHADHPNDSHKHANRHTHHHHDKNKASRYTRMKHLIAGYPGLGHIVRRFVRIDDVSVDYKPAQQNDTSQLNCKCDDAGSSDHKIESAHTSETPVSSRLNWSSGSGSSSLQVVPVTKQLYSETEK